MLALADAAGAERFHLAGHDWGAALAWYVAGRHPGRVTSLAALSVPHPQAFARALISGSQAARSWYMAAWQLPWLPERALGRRGGQAFRDILVRSGLDPASADRYAARARDRPGEPQERDYFFRNTFRLASRRDHDAIKRDIKPVYTAVNAAGARAAMDQVAETWGARYPGVVRLWDNAWEQFIPFLDYDLEIRKVLCSTNAIESLNARYRRAVKARGHFPSEQAAIKCLYLVTRSLDPTGTGRARWAMRWKPALNAFAITFGDRFPAAETY